jgi:endoglucanase
MEYLDTLLERLTLATGIGYSGTVQDVIVQELKGYGVEARIEQDGSVYGHVPGANDRGVMIACHVDEIGFMVSSIDRAGRITFSEIGGTDARILPGQEVVVHGKREVRGYIGAKPPHLVTKEERDIVVPIDKLFIDTGLEVRTTRKLISIGDYISFRGTYRKLQGDLRSVKSVDNRASVACGMLALKALAQTERLCAIHFVATSQEEYTGLGARIHSYRLPVHYACVVDVTFGEYPDLSEHEFFALNSGPVLGRGATIPEKLYELLVEAAKEGEIPYQIEALPTFTGTDAEDIAFNREGIPTCLISIPVRYMHTPVEVVSLRDIDRAQRLLVHFIKKLDSKESML